MPKTALAAGLTAILALAGGGPPASPRRPVTDQYGSVSVRDDYRWLENGSDPEVLAWSDAQNVYARAVLDALPDREAISRRVRELKAAPSSEYRGLVFRAGRLFAIKTEPPKQQPFLVVLRSADDLKSERVLVDPNAINPKGTTALDWFVPSRDGRLVAVSTSEGGSESGTVRVYETETGRALPDVLPRAQGGTAGGSVAWNADGTAFTYTRYPRGNERPPEQMDFYQQIYSHKLGTLTEDDSYSLGQEFPPIAETKLLSSPDGRFVLATVANGDGGEFAHFLLGPDGRWAQIAAFADGALAARFGADGSVYVLSVRSAPRGRILRLAPGTTSLDAASVVVPESEAVLESFELTESLLFAVDIVGGGPNRIRVFDFAGKPRGDVAILPESSVDAVVPLAGDELLFLNQSDTAPRAWYRFAPGGKVARTALVQKAPAGLGETEVVREMVASKDGTRVPLTILRRKGTRLDRARPTLLIGYGGFGISQGPVFDAGLRVWIEQGGVVARASLRGGREFGQAWHDGGKLTKKQNVFDDFLACAAWLIDAGYTRPDRLAIEGGSNGGLLMGAALTQRPDLFRAVVSHVGIYDMLRVELSPNGTFNVTEFGTVKDPGQLQALSAYSPYHRVRDGVRYPAILFMTGANDPRVDPMQSRKMTARLQAATGSSAPILLRTSSSSGHGLDLSLDESLVQRTDVWSFLFWQLGLRYRPVPAPKRAAS